MLALNGVGPETADSILLYAGNHPVFVVDAYTRRILERHEIISTDATYEDVRELCEQALSENTAIVELARPNKSTSETTKTAAGPQGSSHPPSRVSRTARTELVQTFNDMHGLIVGVGKHYCLKSQPRCEQCPLQKFLPPSKCST